MRATLAALAVVSAFPAWGQTPAQFMAVCGLTEEMIERKLGERFAMVPLADANAAGFAPFLAQSIKGMAIVFLVPDGTFCVLWDNTDTGAAS